MNLTATLGRRSAIGAFIGAALLPLVQRLAGSPPAVGSGMLEFAPDGLPYRFSTKEASAYFYDPAYTMKVTIDGALPDRCWEVDRREGWVLCEDKDFNPLPRQYGRVEIVQRPTWRG